MRHLKHSRTGFVLAALISLLATPGLGGQPPSPPEGWTDGFVIANGIRIHYWRTGGDKPVLIMLHGSSDNGLCWTNLAKELTNDYDIIMPDARGHGLSDPPSKSDTADAQAEDIAGLIGELKLNKPIVMGHSMGSSSAAWFAAKHPDIPRAVILEDPRLVPRTTSVTNNANNNTNAAAVAAAAAQEKRRQHILARNNMSYDQIVAEQLKRNSGWGRSEIEIWAESKRQHHPNTAYRSRSGRPPMSDLFAWITAPTLILKADDQGELRQKNIEVTRILKQGRIVHIEGARHNVRRDEKQRLLRSLKAFLGEL
ncbi:MAG: alpha/beta hydrolase [Fuerstiella sp.]|nr:alpha/beta hydrolase [Fuerstiella sp.]